MLDQTARTSGDGLTVEQRELSSLIPYARNARTHSDAQVALIAGSIREFGFVKARGVKLGNPNGAAALRRAGKGAVAFRALVAANADAHARDLAPVLADIRAGGATSLREIAAELNNRGMLTRRGGRWHVSTVLNLLDRLGEARCRRAG